MTELIQILNNPEQAGVLKAAIAAGEVPQDVLESFLMPSRAALVRSLGFGVESFGHFHWCLTGKELSPYAKNLWVPELVLAYKNQTGVLLNCHRGSGKTFLLILWVLYVTGFRPLGSSQIVCINDDKADEINRSVADFIENNPGWKLCFPNVVPDKDKGWSNQGRYLIDSEFVGAKGYGEWGRACFGDHAGEPHILCAGVTSGDIIGKHPSNGQYFDDLHDEGNTRSAREMEEVCTTVEKNIVPTWTRPEGHPTLGVACTLWSEHDAYHILMRTGLLKQVQTPMFVPVDDQTILIGEARVHPNWIDEYPEETELGGKSIKSLWWPAFDGEKIRATQKAHPVYFPLMYLCDLSAAKGKVLKKEWLHEYPRAKIDESWPVYFGIDFASTSDKLKAKDTDYFALSVWVALPGGGAVLVDGFRDRLGSQEAVEKTRALAAMYRTLRVVGVEKWGKGEVFKDQLLFSTNLPIIPYPLEGTPVRSKGQRFEGGLAPLFTTGRAWISDLHTRFIDDFIEEWISWDGQKTKTGHDDCLDAAYWGAMAAQGHLMPAQESPNFSRRDRKASPWMFGRLNEN